MKTIIKISVFALTLININCISSKEVSTFRDLAEAKKSGDLQIVTRDTTIYYIDKFKYTDSTISIFGEKSKDDIRIAYEGTLSFKDIGYIQTTSHNMWGTLFFLGATGYLIYTGVPVMTGNSGIEAIVKIVYPTYPGGDGSCPYIYLIDGDEYKLQGEAFGTALGKSLETETCIILQTYDQCTDEVKIKVTNERPETHFFNEIELVAIETDPNKTVYADNRNSFYAVSGHKEILNAEDLNKTDITDLLLLNDNELWKSDLFSATPTQNYEDFITVQLGDVNDIDSLSLVVTAINTEISSIVFKYLQNILGEEFVNFTLAAETDPEVVDILKKTLERSALKIDIWDGTNWKYVDLIYPEANSIKFSKLARLPVIKDENDIMKLRLRCLSDVWEIDAIKYDDSQRSAFSQHEPKLLECETDSRGPISNIYQKDNLYTKLLPGQSIELKYEPVKTFSDKKITYSIKCQGYLYEWIIDNNLARGDLFKGLSTTTPRLTIVKEILKNLDNVLPIIYNEWKKSRNEFSLVSE
jgi:hypothetical protein